MNSFVPSPGFDVSRLKGTTLILPSVSIGNVPQLATDLFLSTLNLDRVGCIEDENVIPVLGPADRPHPSSVSASTPQPQQQLSLAIEVFQSKDGQWTIVQQRSPTVRHRSHFFADNLIQFIKDSGFAQVVLLASADGARRIDVQLRSGTPVRYIGSPALSSLLVDKIQGLGLQPLESVPPTEEEKRNAEIHRKEQHAAALAAAAASGLADRVQGIQLEGEQEQAQQVLEKVPRIPNGGIARRFHSLCQEQGIAILTLVLFAMEGDNAPDAIFLANVANAILNVHVPTQEQIMSGEGWKFPKSWDSLYGNTHHEDMY
ncbi:proteasome assembly chaperone 2 [Entomortierella parvispora]|uniref:Proteasome assembly chaperone 2 n=1 Tax=Entomortierella parvispora TaxID=205924 RepID=A0A9P3LZF6_9FUNG|nr:proteasome assembly chaperone 2 [Entomortierella parvispora]